MKLNLADQLLIQCHLFSHEYCRVYYQAVNSFASLCTSLYHYCHNASTQHAHVTPQYLHMHEYKCSRVCPWVASAAVQIYACRGSVSKSVGFTSAAGSCGNPVIRWYLTPSRHECLCWTGSTYLSLAKIAAATATNDWLLSHEIWTNTHSPLFVSFTPWRLLCTHCGIIT